MTIKRVALLTAGGFAPCLSAAVGGLIKRYNEIDPTIEIIAYLHGYQGLLLGEFLLVDQEARENAAKLLNFGGSPIGNSRVKLTNAKDLVERGLVEEGVNPLEAAAQQLQRDQVDVLHTIGGDDTNTTAADLAAYLAANDYDLTVVGLPKTVDNDIIPIQLSLGADTAAEQGAIFSQNIVGEHRAGPRMLIINEIMGRHCGWLAAETTRKYVDWVDRQNWVPSLGLTAQRWSPHALYLPEIAIDLDAEAERLRTIMDEEGNVNIFLSEGAGVSEILAEMESRGEEIERDAFGHVRLHEINPGNWFANQFAERLGAEKVLVQKSGYFSRSAKANSFDLALIQSMVDLGVECALRGESGVIGHDEEEGGRLHAIAFPRIAGGKAFNVDSDWFVSLMERIGQPFKPAAK